MSNPVTISTSESATATKHGTSRKLVRTSDGTLYAVYFKQLSGKYQIYVKKSIDDGQTWTDETRISTYDGMDGEDQTYPYIAVDSNDYLHVVWEGQATGYTTGCQIWHAKYTTSWSTPVRISIYDGMENYNQVYPSIAVGSGNYLYVTWEGMATDYTVNYQIWYSKYTTSWTTPIRISTYDGMDVNYQSGSSITVDSSDHLHVVWCGFASGYINPQIWYAKYVTDWVTPIRISTLEDSDGVYPSIAVDSNNHLHVVWHGVAMPYVFFNQIFYTKYTDSWSTPIRISALEEAEEGTGHTQNNPSIAVDSNNYLHVIWHGKAIGYTDYVKVWYAKYETSWGTPECLQATGQNIWPNVRWSFYPTSNRVTDRLDYVFTEGTTSPYNVKFDFLSITPPPPGWTGKISGVTNPAKVMGIAVANVAKVKGVA